MTPDFQPIRTGMLRLEASSACQLRCPSCPTTTGHTEAVVGKSYLRLGDFAQLVDANPWIGTIELSNYGEVFLNPDLLEIFRHAWRRNVCLTIANGANLNHVRDEVLEGVVKYGIATMTCSIDGATQATYVQYRKRGNLDRVLANIRKINAWKQAYKSQLPVLNWQFVAFGHNQHEIPAAYRLAQELQMRFHVKLSWDPKFSPVTDEAMIRTATGTGAATRAEYLEQRGTDYVENICEQLWDGPQINWDGKSLGCCRNFWADFGGNAFRDGLASTLNSERLSYARAMLRGRAKAREDIPCTTCDIYLTRQKTGQWMKREKPLDPPAAAILAAQVRARMAQHAECGLLHDAAALARGLLQLRSQDPHALRILAQAAESSGRAEAANYYSERAAAAEQQTA